MRLFVAVALPEEIAAEAGGLLDELRRRIPAIRWARADSLHLTLKFLGEVQEESLSRLRQALSAALAGLVAPFRVQLSGIGRFPPTGRPRVIWLGVSDESGGLVAMQGSLEQALGKLALPGVRSERRPFHPHLTLARVGEGPAPRGIAELLAEYRDRRLGSFDVEGAVLFQSLLTPSGARYRSLGACPL